MSNFGNDRAYTEPKYDPELELDEETYRSMLEEKAKLKSSQFKEQLLRWRETRSGPPPTWDEPPMTPVDAWITKMKVDEIIVYIGNRRPEVLDRILELQSQR